MLPGEIDELARLHDKIVGALLDNGVVEITVIVPQFLDDDADDEPLESVAVIVTANVPAEL